MFEFMCGSDKRPGNKHIHRQAAASIADVARAMAAPSSAAPSAGVATAAGAVLELQALPHEKAVTLFRDVHSRRWYVLHNVSKEMRALEVPGGSLDPTLDFDEEGFGLVVFDSSGDAVETLAIDDVLEKELLVDGNGAQYVLPSKDPMRTALVVVRTPGRISAL